MTRLIALTLLCATAVCAQATQNKSDRTATTATPAAVPRVPKDAVKNPDGSWSYTDKQGRKWMYVNTPFGIIQKDLTDAEGRAVPPPPAAIPNASIPNGAIKVIDKGDTVRFEQPGSLGPFGPIAWEKKKSDLTPQERQMIDAQQKQTAKPETK